MANEPAALPFHVEPTTGKSGLTVKIVDANGGVVCLMKGKNKIAHAYLLISAVNQKANLP